MVCIQANTCMCCNFSLHAQPVRFKMVLVTRYSALQKQDPKGKFRLFCALRAVGLAVELGHKAAEKQGPLAVKAVDLLQVSVTGSLKVQQGRSFVEARKVSLALRPQDAELAKVLLLEQLSFLSTQHLNVWKVDKQRGAKTVDLLGAFHTSHNYGVVDQVWVETKVFGAQFFAKELQRSRDDLLEVLRAEEAKRKSTVGGVLLVAAKVAGLGSGWASPTLVCQLLTDSEGEWQTLEGQAPKTGRGQCRSGRKPPLKQVLAEMEWVGLKGVKVGLLKHFLAALKLSKTSAGKRAATFNRQLRKHQLKNRLTNKLKLPQKCGRQPWVGNKATFELLYKFL